MIALLLVMSAVLPPSRPASANTPGSAWTAIGPVSTYSAHTYINAIAIDPVDARVVYAGGEAGTGVFKSTDAGSSWFLSLGNPWGFYTRAIAFDPTSPNVLYTGGHGEIQKSIDAGNSWTSLNAGPTYPPTGEVRAIAIDPSNRDTIYVGIYLGGIAKTTDGGSSWATMNVGIGAAPVYALAIDPVRPTTIYAAARGGGIYKSIDGATSWRSLRVGDPSPYMSLSIAIDPANPSTLYVGERGSLGSILKSMDGGDSWVVMGSSIGVGLPSITWADANAVLIDPSNPSRLYVGTAGGGVFTSPDAGATWQSMSDGLTNLDVTSLALSPDGAALYAGTHGSGAFALRLRSADATAPVITVDVAPAGTNGWHSSEVTVTWTTGDLESGIASTVGCTTTTLTAETPGTTLTCSARNGAGLEASQPVTVKIDRTAPTITFSGTPGAYSVDQAVHITCVANDVLSGIATTSCPAVASGPATNYVGTTATTSTTVSASATDNAGNLARASTTFTVTVTASGICRLSASLETAEDICKRATSIAAAPNANAKAGRLGAFDKFVAAESGKSIPDDLATLLSVLAHLL